MITAEGPEFSDRDHSTVVDELQAADTTLHSFVLTRGRARLLNEADRQREFAMTNAARRTGGRREDLLTRMALTSRLQALAAEQKNQYRIVYAGPNTLIGPEKIEVSVDRSGVIVRSPRVPRKDWRTE